MARYSAKHSVSGKLRLSQAVLLLVLAVSLLGLSGCKEKENAQSSTSVMLTPLQRAVKSPPQPAVVDAAMVSIAEIRLKPKKGKPIYLETNSTPFDLTKPGGGIEIADGDVPAGTLIVSTWIRLKEKPVVIVDVMGRGNGSA